jgi:hypothetical protein
MGAVIAYYKSHCGSDFGLKYYERRMIQKCEVLHIQDVAEMTEAFNDNRELPRDHFRKILDTHLIERIVVPKWHDEMEYQQRLLYRLNSAFD